MKLLDRIVVLNLAVLITHQIDAAYWREWEMFQLPGGVQLFDVLNLLIFMVILIAITPVIQRRRSGFKCSLMIAGASALVLPIHAGFWLAGYSQFDMPVSTLVIVGSFVTALTQIGLTLNARAEFVSL